MSKTIQFISEQDRLLLKYQPSDIRDPRLVGSVGVHAPLNFFVVGDDIIRGSFLIKEYFYFSKNKNFRNIKNIEQKLNKVI